jgi:hypothetical protein
LFHFELDNGGKAIGLLSKINGGAMQINFWCIHKHFHAICPINFSGQIRSVEFGMDKVALPMVSVIAVVEVLDVSATVTLLKAEELALASARLDLSQSVQRA